MFFEWLFGIVANAALARVWQTLSGDTFIKELNSAIDGWRSELPYTESLSSSQALFRSGASNTDLSIRPCLKILRDRLDNKVLPREEDWENAFLEQWNIVRRENPETQPFFTISEMAARSHFTDLARMLNGVCMQNEDIFKLEIYRLIKQSLIIQRSKVDHSLLEAVLCKLYEAKRQYRVARGPVALVHPLESVMENIKYRSDDLMKQSVSIADSLPKIALRYGNELSVSIEDYLKEVNRLARALRKYRNKYNSGEYRANIFSDEPILPSEDYIRDSLELACSRLYQDDDEFDKRIDDLYQRVVKQTHLATS